MGVLGTRGLGMMVPQRDVEDVCENHCQLVSTFHEHPSWYVTEAHWFLGVHSPQGSPDISCVKTEWLTDKE